MPEISSNQVYFPPNTGIVEFVNDDTSDKCYAVPIKYQIPAAGFETAVCTHPLIIATESLGDYRPKSGLDYSVRAGRKGTSNSLSLSLFVEDNSWKRISVSYLVSSRNDLYLGSFIIDGFSIFACDKDVIDTEKISFGIENLPRIKTEYQVAVFISGVKTNDKSVGVSIWEPSVNFNTGYISFNLKSNASPTVINLHISYVIWSVSISIGIFRFDVEKGVQADYQLIGVGSFENSYASYFGLAIDIDRIDCIGAGCIRPCISTNDCKKQGGIIK